MRVGTGVTGVVGVTGVTGAGAGGDAGGAAGGLGETVARRFGQGSVAENWVVAPLPVAVITCAATPLLTR